VSGRGSSSIISLDTTVMDETLSWFGETIGRQQKIKIKKEIMKNRNIKQELVLWTIRMAAPFIYLAVDNGDSCPPRCLYIEPRLVQPTDGGRGQMAFILPGMGLSDLPHHSGDTVC
jgi:hypothetical protein